MLEGLLQFSDTGLFILRLVVGIIFIFHSLMKLKNPRGIAQMMGKNSPAMPVVLGLVELLSGLGVILGVYMQWSALLLGIVMIGAIGMKTMQWKTPFASMEKTGWEFDLILLAAAIAILTTGGGSVALL